MTGPGVLPGDDSGLLDVSDTCDCNSLQSPKHIRLTAVEFFIVSRGD